MNTPRPMPDTELIVVQFLLDSGINGDDIGTELPASPPFPYVVVHKVAGKQVVKRHLDAPEIQVDVWTGTRQEGGSKKQAYDLAALADAHLLTMSGIQGDLGVVSGVDEVIGPFWFPDPRTTRPKYQFSVVVFAHPLPARLLGS